MLTARPSRPSPSMHDRQWGLQNKILIVSLSTCSAELTRDLAPSLSVMGRTNGRGYSPILLETWNHKKKPFCGARDTTGLT